MAAAIRNNIGPGLKEVDDFIYSVEQIKDEISTERNAIILEQSKAGILNLDHFAQQVDNIDIDLRIFPLNSGHPSKRVPHIKIPRPIMTTDNSAIVYLGPADISMDFVKYYDASFNIHRYNRVTGNRPYCYIDLSGDGEGNVDVYIFGIESSMLSKMAVREVMDNPTKVLQDAGFFADDEEFPVPGAIQSMIIDRITRKYILYYKQMTHPNEANTNTEKY